MSKVTLPSPSTQPPIETSRPMNEKPWREADEADVKTWPGLSDAISRRTPGVPVPSGVVITGIHRERANDVAVGYEHSNKLRKTRAALLAAALLLTGYVARDVGPALVDKVVGRALDQTPQLPADPNQADATFRGLAGLGEAETSTVSGAEMQLPQTAQADVVQEQPAEFNNHTAVQ